MTWHIEGVCGRRRVREFVLHIDRVDVNVGIGGGGELHVDFDFDGFDYRDLGRACIGMRKSVVVSGERAGERQRTTGSERPDTSLPVSISTGSRIEGFIEWMWLSSSARTGEVEGACSSIEWCRSETYIRDARERERRAYWRGEM